MRNMPALNDRQRVDMIIKYMFAAHRLSLKTFLIHAMTEPPTEKYGQTIQKRTKDISEAVSTPQIASRVFQISPTLPDIVIPILYEKIEQLIHTVPALGALTRPRVHWT
jgi:hypothetical protein